MLFWLNSTCVPCLTARDPKCSCLFSVSILRPLKMAILESVSCGVRQLVYHQIFVNPPLTRLHVLASVLEAVTEESRSHRGLIVAPTPYMG